MTQIKLKGDKPLIISGPCSAETKEQTLETCRQLAATGMVDVLRAGIWKPRTKPGMFEGVGVKGLAWLERAKEETGLPTAVEVATANHVENALEFGVDVLWVGARTTVSPFAVQEIADAVSGNKDITILIKNPMNPDIALWAGAVERFAKVGIDMERIGLIHRGFSHVGHNKYRNPPMWHLVFEMRSKFPEMAMICDPSHIGGAREYLQELSQTAADLRYDGLIIESHIRPAEAKSDAAQQVTPADLATLLKSINWRASNTNDPEFSRALANLRAEIDQIDSELFELLAKRMHVAERIGAVKRDNNVAILQGERWNSIVENIVAQAKELGLSEDFLKTVLQAIHIESINRQNEIMNAGKAKPV